MALPIYRGIDEKNECPPSAHRGLWFDRFFNLYNLDWNVGDNSKRQWIQTVAGRAGEQTQLDAAKKNQIALIEHLKGEVCVLKTQWHFATGLGNPHPVENGFSWHPTLGVPYLAGSAVKGLVRAWVEQWGDDFDQDNLLRLFGSDDKDPLKQTRDNQAGSFIFFDALPIAPVMLACDIMTPHMGKWYVAGGKIENVDTDHESVPADWHNPDLIPFLVARDTRLLFGIAPRNANAEKELSQVREALELSLEWLGAGAKTATGYGRMSVDEGEQREIDARREQAKAQEESSKLAKLAPNIRAIEQLRAEIKKRLPQGKIPVSDALWGGRIKVIAYQALVSNDWSDEEKRALADMLEDQAGQLMKMDGKDLRKQLQLAKLRGQV